MKVKDLKLQDKIIFHGNILSKEDIDKDIEVEQCGDYYVIKREYE